MPKKKQLVSVREQEKEIPYTTKQYEHLLQVTKLEKPNLNDRQAVDNVLSAYFGLCKTNEMKPAISGIGMVLGLSRKQVLDICNGQVKCGSTDIIITYYRMLEMFDEVAMKDGKIPQITGMFMAKNNYGYTDGEKVQIVKEELTNEEIAERYRKMHEIVSEEK